MCVIVSATVDGKIFARFYCCVYSTAVGRQRMVRGGRRNIWPVRIIYFITFVYETNQNFRRAELVDAAYSSYL